MTIVADWSWWTYVILTSEARVISRGALLDLDVPRRWVRFELMRRHGPDEQGPRFDEPGYRAWAYDTREATYDRLYVDLKRRLALENEWIAQLHRGEAPPGFVEFTQDPRDYFAGARSFVSGIALPVRRRWI